MDNGFDETATVLGAGHVIGDPTRPGTPRRERDGPRRRPQHRHVIVPVANGHAISRSQAQGIEGSAKRGKLSGSALHEVDGESGAFDEDRLAPEYGADASLRRTLFEGHLGLAPPVSEQSMDWKPRPDETAIRGQGDPSVGQMLDDLTSAGPAIQDAPVLGDDRGVEPEEPMEGQSDRKDVPRREHHGNPGLGHPPDRRQRLRVQPAGLVRKRPIDIGDDRPDRASRMRLRGRQPSLPDREVNGSCEPDGRRAASSAS